MKVLVVFLQNYVPKGLISHEYINKVLVYDLNQDKPQLIQKMYNDLVKKQEQLDQYQYLYKDNLIDITKDSIHILIENIINDEQDVTIPIFNEKGSAYGRYCLYVYTTELN